MNLRVLGAVLLLGVALAGLALWTSRIQHTPVTAASGRSEYVLRDFELVVLNDEGKESFTLTAPRLQETPGAKTMELTTPVFTLPDTKQPDQPWRVQADSGWVNERQDEIRLRGNVIASSSPQAEAPVTMTTEQLNVFPEQRLATTDAQVEVTQPGITMRGRGMRADFAGERVQLLSQVKTRYASTR